MVGGAGATLEFDERLKFEFVFLSESTKKSCGKMNKVKLEDLKCGVQALEVVQFFHESRVSENFRFGVTLSTRKQGGPKQMKPFVISDNSFRD